MQAWLADHHALVWSLAAFSLVVFVASLLAAPLLLARIPADYFTHGQRPPGRFERSHPALRLVVLIARNTLALLLLGAGLAMLVLPGQGLLTLLAACFLAEAPGKYRVERWLVARPFVHRPVNWLRARRGRPPLRTA